MEIKKEWLDGENACGDGLNWFVKNELENCTEMAVLNKLIRNGGLKKLRWANWLIVRVMTKPQYVQYAIFAAEQVLHFFEIKYPDDKRPRLAIAKAKDLLSSWAAIGASGATVESVGDTWASGAAIGAYWATVESVGDTWASGAAIGAYWAAVTSVGDTGAIWAAGAAWAAVKSVGDTGAGGATWAAEAVAWATEAAGSSWAAIGAAGAARKEILSKILTYGIELLRGGEK